MKSVPDDWNFRSEWYVDEGMGRGEEKEGGAEGREAAKRIRRRQNAVCALAMPPWPPLDMSAGDVSIYHRSTTFPERPLAAPLRASPNHPRSPYHEYLDELASSAYRHPANTHHGAHVLTNSIRVRIGLYIRKETRRLWFRRQSSRAMPDARTICKRRFYGERRIEGVKEFTFQEKKGGKKDILKNEWNIYLVPFSSRVSFNFNYDCFEVK